MPRIFVEPESIKKDSATLLKDDAKKLFRVLRMKPGDHLTLFDGSSEYSAVIKFLNQKSAEVTITGTLKRDSESKLQTLLGQGVPKSEKMDQSCRKRRNLA